MDDPNADLVGYEYEITGDPPTRWRVTGTDVVLGSQYVSSRRVDVTPPSFGCFDSRVQTASAIRRRKQLEQETVV